MLSLLAPRRSKNAIAAPEISRTAGVIHLGSPAKLDFISPTILQADMHAASEAGADSAGYVMANDAIDCTPYLRLKDTLEHVARDNGLLAAGDELVRQHRHGFSLMTFREVVPNSAHDLVAPSCKDRKRIVSDAWRRLYVVLAGQFEVSAKSFDRHGIYSLLKGTETITVRPGDAYLLKPTSLHWTKAITSSDEHLVVAMMDVLLPSDQANQLLSTP